MTKQIEQNLEQPQQINQNLNSQSGNETINQNDVAECEVENCGSKLGKFKGVEALMQAYDNLQSNYTKKCQALSSLQKQIEDNKKDEDEKQKNSSFLPSSQMLKTWQENVDNFLTKNPNAKYFKDDIVKLIKENEQIALCSSPLDVAWAEVAKTKLVGNQALVENESFLENFVYNNSRIKDKILKDYFCTINFEKTPTLMSLQKGAKQVVAPPQKPKTIKDATKLVEDIFG